MIARSNKRRTKHQAKTWVISYKTLERGDEQYPRPLRNRLGGSPPKVEEIKSRRDLAKKMAGAPATAAERRRRRQLKP
jgi:hypothetical protein